MNPSYSPVLYPLGWLLYGRSRRPTAQSSPRWAGVLGLGKLRAQAVPALQVVSACPCPSGPNTAGRAACCRRWLFLWFRIASNRPRQRFGLSCPIQSRSRPAGVKTCRSRPTEVGSKAQSLFSWKACPKVSCRPPLDPLLESTARWPVSGPKSRHDPWSCPYG